jgi:hypothetical protein
MDQSLTPEEKKKIYDDLFDVFFIELKIKKLEVEEGRKIAEYILDNLETIEKKIDLITFLEKIYKKWPLFNNYFLKKKGELIQTDDKEKIKEISNKLNQFIN